MPTKKSAKVSRTDSLKIKAKLLQKAKKRAGKPIALKDAFELLATKSGFKSWREMKATIDAHEILRPQQASALWNVWYGSYKEARKHLEDNGGYLLPYQKQFFICDENYIRCLGLTLDDEDLAKVGADWVKPKDVNAWGRLLRRISRKNAIITE